MAIIRLLDARRGLYRKCEELFGNAKIAEAIYRFLCDGIEECEDVAHERKKGQWVRIDNVNFDPDDDQFKCDRCGFVLDYWIQGAFYNFCPNCGADMREETENVEDIPMEYFENGGNMMPRYIDADALMKEFRDFVRDSNNSDFAPVPTWNDAVSLVGSAQTVDAVERKDIEAECELAYKNGWSDCFAEHRWIPVTERLPEIDMTFPHSESYFVQYEDGDMDVASWSNVNRFWTDHVTEPHWNCVQFQTVVAWMPLPEPYREETEDGEIH